jgi:hypothetical protein
MKDMPIEITVAAANEYGAAASAKLFGVEILNEGWGMSIDDSVNEMQATFVARSIAPLQAVGRKYQQLRRQYQVRHPCRAGCDHRKSLPFYPRRPSPHAADPDFRLATHRRPPAHRHTDEPRRGRRVILLLLLVGGVGAAAE